MRRGMFGWSAGSFVIGNTGLAHLHTCNMILVMVNSDLMCTEQDSNEQSFQRKFVDCLQTDFCDEIIKASFGLICKTYSIVTIIRSPSLSTAFLFCALLTLLSDRVKFLFLKLSCLAITLIVFSLRGSIFQLECGKKTFYRQPKSYLQNQMRV